MSGIESLDKLQEHFASLPNIGPKSAQRLALYVISMPEEQVRAFAEDMYRARLSIHQCEVCGNLTDHDRCAVCEDSSRDDATVCVVRDARDVMAIERVREYRGLYHVLGGTISPLDGVGPDDLRIRQLIERIGKGKIQEVILATNPDVSGEATAVYLARLIAPLGVRVTRIAHGVPVGGELEYTDVVTLQKAIEGRTEY